MREKNGPRKENKNGNRNEKQWQEIDGETKEKLGTTSSGDWKRGRKNSAKRRVSKRWKTMAKLDFYTHRRSNRMNMERKLLKSTFDITQSDIQIIGFGFVRSQFIVSRILFSSKTNLDNPEIIIIFK